MAKKKLFEKVKDFGRTSISDNESYPQFCLAASSDLSIFKKFRRNKAYTEILEHVSEELGYKYLDHFSSDQNLCSYLDKFRENDYIGDPIRFHYEGFGLFSPTTLRYIKVLKDLENYFGDLSSLKLCEIGVGYGGQCRIITSYRPNINYTLVDIKPALSLAQTYLDNFVLDASLNYETMNELTARNYDLVISNYAFTELPRGVQDMYIKKIINNSSSGYVTYNEISPPVFNSYKLVELERMVSGAMVTPENPKTHDKNAILVWGSRR